nr:CDP-glycerol glycerophosphotransferase family protein [uncultured Schaedlerella sp.]
MSNQEEEKSIRKRKQKAYMVHHFYHMLRIFPVKKGKIVFTTFEGDGGFCCNPRYIAEELLLRQTNGRDERYELIWLVNDMKREFPPGIQKVKNTFLNRAYHLTTAQVWVDNSRKAYGTAKRKNQLYIQTWHAALEFKAVGMFRGKLFPRIAYLVSRYDSRLADYVLSNSEWCTQRYPKMLLYGGKILKTGSPRCDIFTTKRAELYRAIRKRYGIPSDGKVVMFAPTFRGGGQKGKRQVYSEEPTLDFEMLSNTLHEKFGGTWYIFLRLHPQLAAQMEGIPLKNQSEYMVDVSQADDMNEVLAAADVFVTDYSSSAFDAVNMRIPVFLYADDLKEYVKDRGELMWDMKKLPFGVADTNEELREIIRGFEQKGYEDAVSEFLAECGVVEDGKASARVADVIEEFVVDWSD